MPRRDIAEAIVADAKQAEGDDFRISVRALEVWRRTVKVPVTVPTYTAATVGANIRKLRTQIGWKQTDLARACGLDAATVSAYERGYRLPIVENLATLAVALCASIEQVLYGVKTHAPTIVRQGSTPDGVRAAERHRKSLRSDREWVTCQRAADLSGLSVRAWRRIANAKSRVGLARKRRRPGEGTKPVWWVHRSVVEARMPQRGGGRGGRRA